LISTQHYLKQIKKLQEDRKQLIQRKEEKILKIVKAKNQLTEGLV